MTFSGANITQWNDKSGNGYNATVASGKVAATWSTASNCVYFQATNVGYQTSFPANPANETLFIVANVDSPASVYNNTIIGGQAGARSFGFGYAGGSGGTGYSSYLNNEVAWQTTSIAGPSAGVTAMITGTVTSTTNCAVSLNGSNFSTTGTITAWTSGTTTYLGTDITNASYYFKGYVMEIIFYNKVLSTREQQLVQGYLAAKWGLNSSIISTHPFKSIPPSVASQFSPFVISSLGLWLDAADLSTFAPANPTNGTTLTQWNDKSGNAYNATPYGTGTTVTYNGLINAVNFLGSAGLKTSLLTPDNRIQSGFFVTTVATGSVGVIQGCSNSSGGREFRTQGTLTSLQENTAGLLTSGTTPVNTLMLVGYTDNGSTITHVVNGTPTTGTSATQFTSKTTVTLGYSFNTEYMVGSINEAIIYGNALTTQQRQAVEGYLAWKWQINGNLPTTHPFYKFSPGYIRY
jgi:hypothetical protein